MKISGSETVKINVKYWTGTDWTISRNFGDPELLLQTLDPPHSPLMATPGIVIATFLKQQFREIDTITSFHKVNH